MFVLAFTNLISLSEYSSSETERLLNIQTMAGMADSEIETLDTLLSELIANPDTPRDDLNGRPGNQINTSNGGFLDYIPDANSIMQQLYAVQAYKNELAYLEQVHTAMSQNPNIASSTPTELALESLLTDFILNPDNPRDDDLNRPGNQIITSDGGFIDYVPDANVIRQQLYNSYSRVSSAPPSAPAPSPSTPHFTNLIGLDSNSSGSLQRLEIINSLTSGAEDEIRTLEILLEGFVADPNNPAYGDYRIDQVRQSLYTAQAYKNELAYLAQVHAAIFQNPNIASSTPTELALEKALTNFILNPDSPIDDLPNRPGSQILTSDGGFIDYVPDGNSLRQRLRDSYSRVFSAPPPNIPPPVSGDDVSLPPPYLGNNSTPSQGGFTSLINLSSDQTSNLNLIDELPDRPGYQTLTSDGGFIDYEPNPYGTSTDRLSEIMQRMSDAESEIRTLTNLSGELAANPDNPIDVSSNRPGNQVSTENGGFIDYVPDSYSIQRQINTARAYEDQLSVLARFHTAISQNPNIDQNLSQTELILESLLTDRILNPDNPKDDDPNRSGYQVLTGDGSTSIDYVPDLNLLRQQLYGLYNARLSSGTTPSSGNNGTSSPSSNSGSSTGSTLPPVSSQPTTGSTVQKKTRTSADLNRITASRLGFSQGQGTRTSADMQPRITGRIGFSQGQGTRTSADMIRPSS